LCFVGRVAAEKGIVEAMEVAKAAGRPLRIAAKIGPTGPEKDYNDAVFQPALADAGKDVEFLGELSQADRDQLFAESHATLMPGSWPEPFGLVAIEALACGTPVLARRVGGLNEIIREGVDGFFGDDVTELAFLADRVADLDRSEIRASVIDRFSATRMADSYEALYARMLGLDDGERGEAGPSRGAEDGPAGRVVEMRREATAAR
jgi:glycosyltransferase involved in cell wall biosynthesis